jgi:hypothetical protein
MNLESEILKEHSKQQTVRIATWIGNDEKRFGELMDLLLHGEPMITQRSAWILTYCAEAHPEMIPPRLKDLIRKMEEPGVHDALKRNVIRMLQWVDIPRPILGKVVSLCFTYLSTLEIPVAVKANAMGVIARIAKTEPDIANELKLVVEQMLPYTCTALQARGRQVLKDLSRKTEVVTNKKNFKLH